MLIYPYKYIHVALLCHVDQINSTTILKIYVEQFLHFQDLCVAFLTKLLLKLFLNYESANPSPLRCSHLDTKDVQ